MTIRLIVPLVALSLVAGACGGSTADTVITSDPVDTAAVVVSTTAAPPTTESVSFESEPIAAGPLFGSASAADQTGESCQDCTPDDIDDPTLANDDPPFVPADIDAPFCSLLAEMEERLFPSDDDEALIIAHAWITELRTVAVDAILGDLDALLEFLDVASASQGQIGINDSTDALDAATDRLDVYVDANCLGESVTASSEPLEPNPVGLDLEIPLVEFVGDRRDEPTPYFGDLDSGSGGGLDTEATPFCLAIHVINNRPQPRSDDMDELRVGKAYFEAIAPVIPRELAEDFVVIVDWVDTVLTAGSFDDVNEPEPGDGISNAVEAVDTYVNERCLTA